jgi:hypothetical protein
MKSPSKGFSPNNNLLNNKFPIKIPKKMPKKKQAKRKLTTPKKPNNKNKKKSTFSIKINQRLNKNHRRHTAAKGNNNIIQIGQSNL